MTSQKSLVDYLILGQGLAGSAFAWECEKRGKSFHVIDTRQPGASSRVAAGLVTPITGGRLVLTKGFDSFWSEALPFYREMEQTLAVKALHLMPLARACRRESEKALFEKRLSWESNPSLSPEGYDPDWRSHVSGLEWPALAGIRSPVWSGFEQQPGAWMDTSLILNRLRERWHEWGQLTEDLLNHEDVSWKEGGVHWKGIQARYLVHCAGAFARFSPWFSWAPFRCAKGQILDFECPDLQRSHLVSHEAWVLPVHGGFRGGATYETRDLSPEVKEEETIGLIQKLQRVLDLPFKVTQARVGIRPILAGTRVRMGKHPSISQLVFFNGLGSKGVLKAPWHARRLMDHLESGAPLPEGCDLLDND